MNKTKNKSSGNYLDSLRKKTSIGFVYTRENFEDMRIKNWIDTGNYLLNALISGDIYKGIPGNKVIQLAGPSSTGKTYITQDIVKSAQKQGYNIIYYDTEGAQDLESLTKRGIDLDKLMLIKLKTVEELNQSIVELIKEIKDDDKVLIVIDSLGQLTTEKEYFDISEKKNVRDMTRAQKIKGLTRTISIDLNIKNIPLILINHTYTAVGAYVPMQKTSGGAGVEYTPSISIILSKKLDKTTDKKEVIGAIITAKTEKSRISKDNKKIEFVISYSTGVSRYGGLFPYAVEYEFIKKDGNKYEYKGEKLTKKSLTPEFFENLLKDGLAEFINKDFTYQSSAIELTEGIIDEDETNTEE